MKKVNTIKLGIIIGFITLSIVKVVYEIECATLMPRDAWGMIKYFYTSSPLWITILWVIFSVLAALLVAMYLMTIPTKEK
jgi:uncharacterized membrane protein